MDWNKISPSIKRQIDKMPFDLLLLSFVANVSFAEQDTQTTYYESVIIGMTEKQKSNFSEIVQKKVLSPDFIEFYNYYISENMEKHYSPTDELTLLNIFYNVQTNNAILDLITKKLLDYNKSLYFNFKNLGIYLSHNRLNGYESYENAIQKLEESVSRVVNTDKMFNRKLILDMLFVVSTFPETNGYYIDLKQFNMLHLVENPTVSGIFDYSKLAIN
jgi:hypothetical protein